MIKVKNVFCRQILLEIHAKNLLPGYPFYLFGFQV